MRALRTGAQACRAVNHRKLRAGVPLIEI